MPGLKVPAMHYCGMCDQKFTSKSELSTHTRDHAANDPPKPRCPVCKWEFPDSLSLEKHQVQNQHLEPRFSCENCKQCFVTQRSLDMHTKPPFGCSSNLSGPITCDRCSDTFSTLQDYDDHRSYKTNGPCADHNHKSPPKLYQGYKDPDKPKNAVAIVVGYTTSDDGLGGNSDSDAPTNMSDNQVWCGHCKTRYASQAKYNLHALWCTTKHESAADALPEANGGLQNTARPARKAKRHATSSRASGGMKPQGRQQVPVPLPTPGPAVNVQPVPSPILSTTAQDAPMHHCSHPACGRSFKTEPGLKQHMGDVHGIGGQPLDLMGHDSWMLNQRTRELHRTQGLTQPTGRGRSPRGRGNADRGRGGGRGHGYTPSPSSASRAPSYPVPAPIPAFGTPPHAPTTFRLPVPQSPLAYTPVQMPMTPPIGHNMGDAFEKEQAKEVQGKILRLLIQGDIFIHHDGKFEVGDFKFTRVPTAKQGELAVILNGMCHLPKILQGEYLPPPKAFLKEYKVQYPSSEFEPSPPRDGAKPGVAVVALVCSKVTLANDLQEVVKIAAVDLITCRILMDHLVCTNPDAKVKNWNTNETGMFGWEDMEEARSQGYKVFKGWSAARAALWKFVDKNTIIVGHNLRSDLDSLRMIHGRAVDIAKVAEKAAKGPLSTKQLGLYSLCRDFPLVMLKVDPTYGCDVLLEAFAAREMALWIIKNKDNFERKLRENSLAYQAIRPVSAAA